MADIKEMGYMLLIVLVSISGIVEWAGQDATLGEYVPLTNLTGVSTSDLVGAAGEAPENFDINQSIVETQAQTNPIALGFGALGMGLTALEFLFKMLFGWSSILIALFGLIEMTNLAWAFIAPIAMIELLMIYYLGLEIAKLIWRVG